MSKARYELKNPENFYLKFNPVVAEKLRKYCAENQFIIGKFVEELIIEDLIARGAIVSHVALSVEIMEREDQL